LKKSTKITLSEFKKEPFIDIYDIRDTSDDPMFSNYQRYNFYQLLWFTKVGGNKLYFLDFKEYKLEEDQIILVFPGQIDRLDVEGKEGYLFTIHNDVMFDMTQHLNSDFLNGYFSNVVISLNEEIKNVLQKMMELMLLEYNSRNRLVLMQSYMEAFLFHVNSFFENTDLFKNLKDNISDPLVAELMRLIDKKFILQKETEFYGKALGVSNRRVNEICKKGSGKTIKQHLQERLILEIKKEIKLRKKSLKEIAFELGFSEPAYFTRFFKIHTSMTPKEFRDS